MATTDENKAKMLQKIREKHPDRIPVVLLKREDSKLPDPANSK